MRRLNYCLVILELACVFTMISITSELSAAGAGNLKVEDFRITDEPAQKDWVYFLQMPETERQTLWAYQTKKGYKLKDWSWGWRLGWMRVCSKQKTEFCKTRLFEGLKDRALVVRAEAATHMGNLYSGTADRSIVARLENAFREHRNDRNEKPLYVQQRLLEAIHKISGAEAKRIGGELAAKDPANLKYWNQITRF